MWYWPYISCSPFKVTQEVNHQGVGKLAPWRVAHTGLVEDPCSVPRTHFGMLPQPLLGNLMPSFCWPQWESALMCTYPPLTYIYITKIETYGKKKKRNLAIKQKRDIMQGKEWLNCNIPIVNIHVLNNRKPVSVWGRHWWEEIQG